MRLQIPPRAFRIHGAKFSGTIFDTGTTYAYLASPIYAALLPALVAGSTAPRVRSQLNFELCFGANATSKFARVRLHFRGGVVVTVPGVVGVSGVRRTRSVTKRESMAIKICGWLSLQEVLRWLC